MHFILTIQYMLEGEAKTFTHEDVVEAMPGFTRQALYRTAVERTRQTLAFKREHRVATADITVLYFQLESNSVR